jgi:hypothetical protein
MNVLVHEKLKKGFTIPEVTLAVGIVAFGLVAIFSILPFGLSAQKDNREETIVRYEAEYWFAVLQAGGQPLEELDRVETIELKDTAGSVYRANWYDLSEAGKASWSVDVCGWLSAPKAKVPRKFARVRSINGSLFDRLYSPRGQGGHYLEGGEFSFGYLLETQIERLPDSGSRITLTFYWPISEPVETALNSGKSIDSIVDNPQTRLANTKTFSILTNLRPNPALSYVNLDARQSQFMRAGLPGDEVSIDDLKTIFPDRKSLESWDGFSRQLVLNAAGLITVMIWNDQDKKWMRREEFIGNPIESEISEAFHWNDVGLFLHIGGQNVSHSISNVHLNGHYLTLTSTPGIGFTPTPTQADYTVSFLKPLETWGDVLSDYQRFGLVEKRQDKYRVNSIYNSDAIGALTNSAGQTFRVPLEDGGYWPAKAPSSNRDCSFWFLR